MLQLTTAELLALRLAEPALRFPGLALQPAVLALRFPALGLTSSPLFSYPSLCLFTVGLLAEGIGFHVSWCSIYCSRECLD